MYNYYMLAPRKANIFVIRSYRDAAFLRKPLTNAHVSEMAFVKDLVRGN